MTNTFLTLSSFSFTFFLPLCSAWIIFSRNPAPPRLPPSEGKQKKNAHKLRTHLCHTVEPESVSDRCLREHRMLEYIQSKKLSPSMPHLSRSLSFLFQLRRNLYGNFPQAPRVRATYAFLLTPPWTGPILPFWTQLISQRIHPRQSVKKPLPSSSIHR